MARQYLLMITGFILFSITSIAQDDKVPGQVKETFTNQYPNAQDVVYKDNLVNVMVNFTLNGDKMIANYTKKGVWKYSEKDWAFDQLPDNVKDGFHKSKFSDWDVEETRIVYRPGGMERYRVKVKKNDVQKKYLFFNKDGQLVEDNITF